MNCIQHRVNRIADLRQLPVDVGAEIDLRSDVNRPSHIHLSHDAWSKGDSLIDWLDLYRERNVKGTIIFNTKEDGLEEEVFSLVKKLEIENFFFLDTAFPTLVKYVIANNAQNFCCRLSIFEPEIGLEMFKGKVPWVWADCLLGQPLQKDVLESASQNFKICLVSPELVKLPIEEIQKFSNLRPYVNSVCTKRVDLWR